MTGETGGLRRQLGVIQLLLLGVGCVVGAGIYILPGVAAAEYAGPAVSVAFLLAGLCCGLAGLCYAELAASMPEVGSAYLYARRAFGERASLWVGWMLMLEYWLAGATVATGFAAYLQSLLGDLGLALPGWIVTPTLARLPDGRSTLQGTADLAAFGALVALALPSMRGVQSTAWANTALVAVKIGMLLLFLSVGALHLNPALWHPFVPPSDAPFHYGASGVLRATSIVIFAYLGFDAVANAAAEARDPARGVPLGLIGTLAISAALYVAVSLVVTGLVPYAQLDVPDPVARAMTAIGHGGLTILLKLGALAGLGSVMLVNTYGHARICLSMARAGMLPGWLARVEPRSGVPRNAVIAVMLAAGIAAALFPIGMLADIVSVGTMGAFAFVALSTMRLRVVAPDLPRRFRVPLPGRVAGGMWWGVVPVAAFVVCLATIAVVLADLGFEATRGRPAPLLFLGLYALAAVLVTERLIRRRGRA